MSATPKRARLADALAAVASEDYVDASSAAASAVDVWHRDGQADVIEYMLGELSITPAAAWELLATRGVIPMTWVADPARRFARVQPVAPLDRVGALLGVERLEPLPHPETVADCVAFASDAPGVLAAEAIAREITGVDTAVWRVRRRADDERSPYPAFDLAAVTGRLGMLCRRAYAAGPQATTARVRDLLATGYGMDAVTDLGLVCPALDGAT